MSQPSSDVPSSHSDDGKPKENLLQCEPMEIIDDTLIHPSIAVNLQSLSVNIMPTVESAHRNKRTISKDRNKPCRKRTRTTKSSQISGQASTSNVKACYGWWTQSCEDMSKKLSSPIAIDSADSGLNSCNGFVTEVIQTSWSKTKKYVPQVKSSQTISWPSSMFSPADTTECADTVQCQKIRLKPTQQQAVILRKWMKAARATYNQALHLVKSGKAKPNLSLKKLVVTARKEDGKRQLELHETPADIRKGAVHDLLAANKSAWAGFKAKLQRTKTQKSRWKKRKKQERLSDKRRWKKRKAFEVKFKSRRLSSDSFTFERKSIRTDGTDMFLFSSSRKFGMQKAVKLAEPLKQELKCDCRISYAFGRWYLLAPYKTVPVRLTSQRTEQKRIVALDPGVRTFATYYASCGEQGELGADTQQLSEKLYQKCESIKQRIKELKQSGGPHKRINKLTRAWYRVNARSQHLATDFHYKAIKYLLDNFECVIAPKLNVGFMMSGDSVLRQKTKRTMAFQRHFQFNQRLQNKAKMRCIAVHDLEEHGTSVTCSSCGNKKTDLGSSKVYRCGHCGLKADRDANSAKNHLLKAVWGETKY